MERVPFGVLSSALVIAALLLAGLAVLPGARSWSETAEITQSPGSLAVEIHDMFNVPYREWWDWRFIYGDFPLTADCFSFESIPAEKISRFSPTATPGTQQWTSPSNGFSSNDLYATAAALDATSEYGTYGIPELAGSPSKVEVGLEGKTEAVVFSPNANPGTQQWTSPSNGFSSNDLYATAAALDATSEYGTYGITGYTSGNKVEVGLEGKVAPGGDDDVEVEFSTNAGVAWTLAGTVDLGTTDSTTFFDVTFLRAWTSTLLSDTNFRTRIVYLQRGSTASTISVDWVLVQLPKDDDVRVDFSTDGGTNWAFAGTVNLGGADTTTFFDVTLLRTWTYTLLSNTNFRTRIVYVQVGTTASTNSVDWVPVQLKEDSPNPSGTGACDKGVPGYSGETWAQYPYINPLTWFHSQIGQDLPYASQQVYTSYRMNMTGVDQPGANLTQPVYLPVFNPSEPPGSTLKLDWKFRYLTSGETEISDFICQTSARRGYDGFVSQSTITVTMDLQESKRIFGVDATPPTFSPSTNPGTVHWTNGAFGRFSDDAYATTATSGQIEQYGSYGISQLGGSPKVEVGLEGKTQGDDDVKVEFSTDAGVTWTTAGTVDLGTTDSTTFFDVTGQRSWTYSLLSNANFRTRITYVQVGTASTNSVDWVPVRVTSTVPASEAQLWWDAYTDPSCRRTATAMRQAERNWETFMVDQGGTAILMAPYDVYNSFEWFYQPFMTNLYDTGIDPVTGETTILIDHVAFGPEVLFPRWFHWGPTLYLDPGSDGRTGTEDDILNAESYPHTNAGWWDWELAWVSDLHFATTIGATDQDFTLDTVMDYHMDAFADPGDDGIFHSLGPDLTPGGGDDVPSTDDITAWHWMPVLTDYTYGHPDFAVSRAHTVSELDPYAGPNRIPFDGDDLKFTYGRPGMVYFGTQMPYELVPAEWDLGPGDKITFRLPNSLSPNGGVVTFIDAYSPLTSDRNGANLILVDSKIGFLKSEPLLPTGSSATDSDGDGILDTITFVGPWDWGLPGQPLWGAPSLKFSPAAPPIQVGITAPWSQLCVGQTMGTTVRATVAGVALPGATVTAAASAGLTVSPASGTTGPDGSFTTTVRGAASGAQSVTASVSKSGFSTGSARLAIDVPVDCPVPLIAASSNRKEMMYYETATITVSLADQVTGLGVTGAIVTGSSRLGGNFSAVTELGGGQYEFRWDAPKVTVQTVARIDARTKVGGYTDKATFLNILIDPNKTNLVDPTQLFVLAQASATSVSVGGTVTVTLFAYTIEGFVVSGAKVTASLGRSPGSLSPVADLLDGVYRFTYTAPSSVTGATTVTIVISAIKDGYATGSTRVSITVVP